MGFSQVAVAALLFGAAMFFGADLSDAYFSTEHERQEAWREANQLHHAQLESAITIISFSYNNGADRLTVEATNDGSVALDASKVDVVVDGVWKTDEITRLEVDGDVSNGVWAPDTTLEIQITLSGYPGNQSPGHIVVINEYGVQDVWRD